jgi:putative addiction module component (TIGR02574 family)
MSQTMDPDLDQVLRSAMKLPPEARAALAGSLLESLDNTLDEGAEAAWETELARRVQELDSGAAKPVAWSEARRTLLEP